MTSTEFWRGGTCPPPIRRMPEYARGLEDAGWDGITLSEGQGGAPDPYLALASAAAATSRLKVGTGVCVPTRHPQVIANTMVTLNAIAEGRTCFSLGRGDGAMHQLGRQPMKVAEFELYVQRLQGYLRREDVDLDGFSSTINSMFVRDTSMDIGKVYLDVAATGPKVISIAARLADGVSFAVGALTERLAEMVQQARDVRNNAGLNPGELRCSCFIPIAVGEGEALVRAREYIRGVVMTQSRFMFFQGKPVVDVSDSTVDVVRHAVVEMADAYRSHGQRGRAGAFYPSGVIDDDFLDKFAVVGSAEQCAERLAPILALNFDRIVFLTKGIDQDPDGENEARIARELLPLLRRHVIARHEIPKDAPRAASNA